MGNLNAGRCGRTAARLYRTARAGACGLAAAVMLGGCAGRELHAARGPGSARVESFDADTRGFEVAADTTGVGDLLEKDLPDDEDKEADARANDAAPESRPPGGGSWELTAIAGYRAETRFRVSSRRGLSAGLRAGESFAAGYVRYEGRGFVRSLHVGRMTIRAGERLLLGRGLGDYASSGVGRVRRGFAVAPSLSAWFGVTGAAVEMAHGGWRFQSAAFGPPHAVRALRPQCVWNSVLWELSRASLCVMAAFSETTAPELAGEPGGMGLSALGGHAVFHGEGFDASAEAARIGDDSYFAGRIGAAGRRTRWSFFAFDAPYDVPAGCPGLDTPTARYHGAVVSLSSRLFGMRGSARLSAGERVSRTGRDAYRRLVAELENGGRGTFRWKLRVDGRSGHGTGFPANPVVRDLAAESSRALALRASVWIDSHRSVQTGARVDYLPPAGGFGPGTVVSVAMDVETARIGARLAVTGHSLAPGRRSFVSRPGLGAFEWFGSLYGEGSDLSIRVRLGVTRESRLLFFYGSSWRGGRRVYAGLERRC